MTTPNSLPKQGRVLALFSGQPGKCPPCVTIKPLLAAEAVRRPGMQYVVLEFDDPAKATLYREHGVRSTPTVVYFFDGVEVGRFSGLRNAEQIAEALNRWNVA